MPEMSRDRLIKLLVVLFIIFSALGWAIASVFTKYNTPKTEVRKETIPAEPREASFEGIITFVDPQFNPGEGISFYLADAVGNEIILLKSGDQKLEVSEGLFVTVTGEKEKTSIGKEYLMVSKVVLKNGSN